MLICPLLIRHPSFTAQFIRVTVFISFEALTACMFAWRFTVWVYVCYVNRLSLNLVNSVIHQKFDWNSQFRPTTQLNWNRDFPEFSCHLIPVKNVWTPEGKKERKKHQSRSVMSSSHGANLFTGCMLACTSCAAAQFWSPSRPNIHLTARGQAEQVSCITNLRTVTQPIELMGPYILYYFIEPFDECTSLLRFQVFHWSRSRF